MERKNLAMAILCVCTISLIAGIFVPQKHSQIEPSQSSSSLFEGVDTTGDRIALLNIEGAISSDMNASSWSNEFSVDAFLAGLDRAQKDNKVKAVLIRINSPGGTVAASQDIYDALMRLRKEKPVVVSMADMAASGAYYIASAADRIVAQKGTMTGSIGVIFNFVDVADLTKKIGITSNVIKSGKFKDAGSMYRKMTTDEKDLFAQSVLDAYGQFVSAITDGRVKRDDKYGVEKRDLSLDTLLQYADGRVFLGDEAYKLGFVDELGSQYDARLLASSLAGSSKPLPLVSYNKITGLKSLLMSVDSFFHRPMQELIPFSYSHSSQPLMMWE